MWRRQQLSTSRNFTPASAGAERWPGNPKIRQWDTSWTGGTRPEVCTGSTVNCLKHHTASGLVPCTGRFKNVPGWGALHEAFPTAAWYIAIDDDAYWVQSSFRSFISHFDPDQPHYLGNPFGFDPSHNAHTGMVCAAHFSTALQAWPDPCCDLLRCPSAGDQFEGGQMPHGGEGMILSR